MINAAIDNSEIVVDKNGGTSFSGRDAVLLYRAMTIRSAISLHVRIGMIPTRGMTITKMLTLAGQICGKTFKRGQSQQAIDALDIWCETMKAALPIKSN